MVPTKIERSSWIDTERPLRIYTIDPDKEHKAVRLTYRLGGRNEYWGVQMTDWEDAPVLSGRNFVRKIGGRRYELYYNGPRLHMVVLRTDGVVVLGRQHPARPALERDDDRDREEPAAARDAVAAELSRGQAISARRYRCVTASQPPTATTTSATTETTSGRSARSRSTSASRASTERA